MKVARYFWLVLPALMAGCANPRTFSGSAGGYGSGGGATYASPTPLESSGPAGTTLGDPSDDFTRRSNKPISPSPRTTTPAARPQQRSNATPTPAPKGPTLGLPTARMNNGSMPGTQASITSPPLGSDSPSASQPRGGVQVPLVWNRRYQSTERRPIETLAYGIGPRRVLVISSMHGDEPQSSALVEEMAAYARSYPGDIAGLLVLFIHSPNPDGLAGRNPVNSHGVDLNRNFPSQNWVRTPDGVSGSRPGSELETQVLVRIASEFKPQLIVHVKDSRDKGRINAEGSCKELAEKFSQKMGFEMLRDGGARTSGSIENYAATRLNCPTLTVIVPLEKDDASAWQKNGDALLSILNPERSEISARPTETAAEVRRNPPSTPDAVEGSAVSSRESKQPRSVAARSRSKGVRSAEVPGVPDRGYHELPSPDGR